MLKTTLGRLPREAIRTLEPPVIAADLLEGYRALVDLTGTLSDAMDELGIVGVIPACSLPPVNTGTRIVGNPRWEAHLTTANYDLIERLSDYAVANGMELLDLAFAWLLAKPAVASVIAGAMSAEQVARNAKAGSHQLTQAQVAEVDALLDT